ncbi:MAG: histidinol-phosphatase [Clostridia bacterium]|nr:histidinol-phosphatase [Clostridia bacterium]
MTYNYHTHTHLCSHASGTIEEYILAAIEGGIKYMGFSDHAPYICSDGSESLFRVPVDKAKKYYEEINQLRDKYKDEITISIGFEMEYFPEQFEDMLKNVISYGAEYLILGPHYITEEIKGVLHSIDQHEDVSSLKMFCDNVINGIKTGVFTYVAHPDMFNFTGDDLVYQENIRQICKASFEYKVPLEINFLGIRDNRIYPNEKFWQIAGEEKSPVTFGFDAHSVIDACDRKSLNKAEKLVEKYNLNYIGMPSLILINK